MATAVAMLAPAMSCPARHSSMASGPRITLMRHCQERCSIGLAPTAPPLAERFMQPPPECRTRVVGYAYTLLLEAAVVAASFGILWLSFWVRGGRRPQAAT